MAYALTEERIGGSRPSDVGAVREVRADRSRRRQRDDTSLAAPPHKIRPIRLIGALRRLTPVAMNMIPLADLRLTVKICTYIRERLVLMGIDPMLAVSLRVGDEAAAELAADEAAAELATDELHDHGEGDHDTATLDILDKKIGLIARPTATEGGRISPRSRSLAYWRFILPSVMALTEEVGGKVEEQTWELFRGAPGRIGPQRADYFTIYTGVRFACVPLTVDWGHQHCLARRFDPGPSPGAVASCG